jgi:predicted porin
MHTRFVYLAVVVLCPFSFSAHAAEASANPDETASPQGSPTPTGADIPSDVKAPPAPHKPFDFTLYGRVNVSFDVGNQELTGAPCITAAVPCAPPVGQLRWLPDLSSNLSRLGVRGYYDLSGREYQAVFQLEAQVDVTATPGNKANGNNDTINPGNNAVTSAFGTRNSYVGFSTPFGALKAGKNDTPYKTVTADFDFLADTPADYNSIMGNTGGDNRTEFDARMPHAIWYESPEVFGFRLNALWSPGQNRFEDNIGFATAENVCAGGNSGPCNDGSFGDAYGFSLEWHGYGFKLIASHEMHRKTNRTGDAGQDTGPTGISAVGTADEYAWKFGAKYTFAPTGTTVAGIFEEMRRNDVSAFNERQRDGYYLSALQKIGPNDDVMASWAHANSTPGDPGAGPIDNAADMIGVGVRHWFNPKTTLILSYAHMSNGLGAHYAIGPGGHGVTWDCKDGGGPATAGVAPGIGLIGNGTGCFTGTSPQAFSLGMTYDF